MQNLSRCFHLFFLCAEVQYGFLNEEFVFVISFLRQNLSSFLKKLMSFFVLIIIYYYFLLQIFSFEFAEKYSW
jgi:hypothetical protein